LRKELSLKLHPNKVVLQEVARGVAFLGAVVYPWRIHPGTRAKGNARIAVRGGNIVSVESYMGLMKHYKNYRMWEGMFQSL
jgi:hypothetical protein